MNPLSRSAPNQACRKVFAPRFRHPPSIAVNATDTSDGGCHVQVIVDLRHAPSPRDWRGESAAAGHSRAQDGGARRRFRHDRAHVQSTGGCHERPFGSGAFLAAGPTGDWLAFATNCDIERIFGSSRSVIHGFRVERKEGEPPSAVHVYVVSKGARTPSANHSQCDHSPAMY